MNNKWKKRILPWWTRCKKCTDSFLKTDVIEDQIQLPCAAEQGAKKVSQNQGCIFRLMCSYRRLTKDHVLTSAYVKIFRTVMRNAANKSVWRKKDCSWLPLKKHAMNIWLSSLRIRAHLREVCRKSKWKFKMAFAMKGGGVSRGSRVPHTILKNDFC